VTNWREYDQSLRDHGDIVRTMKEERKMKSYSEPSKHKKTYTPTDRLEVRPMVTDHQQPTRPPVQARGHTAAARLASILGLALLVSPALSPQAATPLGNVQSWHWVNHGASGLCLGVASTETPGPRNNGQRLELVPCTDDALTVWTHAPLGAQHFTYTNESTRLCWDTDNAGTANGTPAVQGACTGSDTQAWIAPPVPDPSDDVRNLIQKGSTLCLDAHNGAMAVGTPVVIGTCNPSSATQRWIPQAASGDTKFSGLSGVGSHNTYQIDVHPNWTHFVNALDSGVRQVEIDVWLSSGTWEVSHDNPLASSNKCVHDPHTYADLYSGDRNGHLYSCLENLRLWSEHNPGHDPVIVKIEMKDGFWDQVSPFRPSLNPEHFDDTLASFLGSVRIFTPADLMTGTHLAEPPAMPYETLDDAAAADAWPTVNALKGKFIVLLIRGTAEFGVLSDFSDQEYIDQRLKGQGASTPAMAFPVLAHVQGAGDPRPDDDRRPHYIFFDGAAVDIPADNTFYKPGYMLTLFDAQQLSPGSDTENPTTDQASEIQDEAAKRGATIAQTDWWNVSVNSRVISRQ
jgi:hypothetical protein